MTTKWESHLAGQNVVEILARKLGKFRYQLEYIHTEKSRADNHIEISLLILL